MLLRFSVENHQCFADETELSLVATRDDKHPEHLLDLAIAPLKAVRGAAIYGANGHGKTKLVEAMSFARKLILGGTKADKPVGVRPFRLDDSYRNKPSVFEFVIQLDSAKYTYGFAADTRTIVEEWLYSKMPKKKEVVIFERTTYDGKETKVDFGTSLARKNSKEYEFLSFVARGTRPNQLFLTEAIERNVDKLKSVYSWFQNNLTIITAETSLVPLEVLANDQEEEPFVEFMGRFLKMAGTGIDGVTTEEEPLDFEKISPRFPDELRKHIEGELAEGHVLSFSSPTGESFALHQRKGGLPVLIKLKTQHVAKNGIPVKFDFADESSGTQRLMQILPILAEKSRKRDQVFVIDELDRKLHPLLSRLFVQAFWNMKGSCQLIFTTHESNLLDLDLLRRDEIWFVEKAADGKAQLYSLVNLKVRPDLKIEKGYLQGRFGAIPYAGDPGQLLSSEHDAKA